MLLGVDRSLQDGDVAQALYVLLREVDRLRPEIAGIRVGEPVRNAAVAGLDRQRATRSGRVRNRRSARERREADHVVEEFRPVEADDFPDSLVCEELDRVVNVVVEREAKRDQLAGGERIGRRPRIYLRDRQKPVLLRKRMRGDIRVDAVRIRLEGRLRIRGDRRQRCLRRAPQSERPQLDIRRQCGGAEDLGLRAAGLATVHVHLEEPVLCMQPAVEEKQVVFVEREDVRNPVRFARDHSGLQHPRELREVPIGHVMLREGGGRNEKKSRNDEMFHRPGLLGSTSDH